MKTATMSHSLHANRSIYPSNKDHQTRARLSQSARPRTSNHGKDSYWKKMRLSRSSYTHGGHREETEDHWGENNLCPDTSDDDSEDNWEDDDPGQADYTHPGTAHKNPLETSNPPKSKESIPSARNKLLKAKTTPSFDELTDWATNDQPRRPVIREYEPAPSWLWTKWQGTVLSLTIVPVIWNICMSLAIDVVVKTIFCPPRQRWGLLLLMPPENCPIVEQLQGLNTLWGYQVTLITFVLTFFTVETYKHWRQIYCTIVAIQGRINDLCLLITIGADQRENPAAGVMVNRCTRLIKTSHTFFWATTPTFSNGVGDGGMDERRCRKIGAKEEEDAAIAPLLLGEEGLESLVRAGELLPEEANALLCSGLPFSQYHHVLLGWVGIHLLDGFRAGLFRGGPSHALGGLQENLLRQLTSVRKEYVTIGDVVAGRMPLAYVHLVQILVDSLVFLAPLAMYSELGTLSALLSGLLTLFFKGLLELSKSFLDPFGNEGYPGENIRVDNVVAETNFAAKRRWVEAAEAFPDYPV